MPHRADAPSWIESLSEADLAFLKRFVLVSGSLKDLAGAYGVTYPTIRIRLDRLVGKIKLLDQHNSADEFERVLLGAFAEGKLDASTMKALLSAHHKQMSEKDPLP